MPRPLYLILALALVALHAAVGGSGATISLCLGDQCDVTHAPDDHEHPACCDHDAPVRPIPAADHAGCCCTDLQIVLPGLIATTGSGPTQPEPCPEPPPAARPAASAPQTTLLAMWPRPPDDHPGRLRLAVVRATRLNL